MKHFEDLVARGEGVCITGNYHTIRTVFFRLKLNSKSEF